MPDRPLFLFPSPERADRDKLSSGPGRTYTPTHRRQGERVTPKFRHLQEAWDARHIEIQRTAAGVDPEQVLVIEIIGSIDNFANAIKMIEGFEWMGEIEVEDISPDIDFYNKNNPEKELRGRLFLVMANQQALRELLSLWNLYKRDENLPFARGYARFRKVFLCLYDIRRWDVQDRLYETGVLDVWAEDLMNFPDQAVRVEIELWYRNSENKRQASEQQITSLIENLGGRVSSRCILPEISYHSILAELPRRFVQQVIEHADVDLVKCDNVMYFRPMGQLATGKTPVEGDLIDFDISDDQDIPVGDPIVAIFDGLPLANHSLLADRLVIDDPDDYAANYTVSDLTHGTAISSLVVQGDLSYGENPLPRPVYVRPIMTPIVWINSSRPVQIPTDVLVVDLIHRSVRRLFEGDDLDGPASPNIKIINLSIGDRSCQFIHAMSPLARLLDWLSVKYNILFVISAGNHLENIETDISTNDFKRLNNDDREELCVNKLYEHARNRRLLSPAESINNLSIGALHSDNSNVIHADNTSNIFSSDLPSPVSAFGGGYRRSMKPDFIYEGGRILYNLPPEPNANAILKSRTYRLPPGIEVASPSDNPGDINKTAYCCGTSNSAALVSRELSICHDTLLEIFDEQVPGFDYLPYIAPLLKAMIVHSCSWNDIGERLKNILETDDNGQQISNWVSRWLGYGVPDCSRVLDCTGQRVSILGFGHLNDGEGHVFSLPLPPSLASQRILRKLTVTLAYFSKIASGTQKYRISNLWFDVDGVPLTSHRQDADWRTVRRGTVQHEIFTDDRAVPFGDGDLVKIKVNCKKDARKMEDPVSYGLAVSLEVAEGIDMQIYDEVRTRIAPVVEIFAGGGQ